MAGYVEHDYVVDIEKITGDQTIGVLHLNADNVDAVGGNVFDVGRLRRALLVAEEDFNAEDVYLSFVEDAAPDAAKSVPALLMRESPDAKSGVVLAGKLPPEGGDD